jgi:hypothetical protein
VIFGIIKNYLKAYKQWLLNRRTISEICADHDVSYPKLIKEFDKFDVSEGLQEEALGDIAKPINLLIDATFFGKEYGFLVFSANYSSLCDCVICSDQISTEKLGTKMRFLAPIFLIMPAFIAGSSSSDCFVSRQQNLVEKSPSTTCLKKTKNSQLIISFFDKLNIISKFSLIKFSSLKKFFSASCRFLQKFSS